MANVLVTGGSGLIGWRTAERLLADGHKVVIYDLHPNYGRLRSIADQVTIVGGDVTDVAKLLHVARTERIDHIVHLAAIITRAAREDPGAAFRVNVQGTSNILHIALTLGMQRVVWTSSVVALGVAPDYDGRPVDESYAVASRSPYGASKWASEVLAQSYRETFGLDVIGIRPASTYGIGRLNGGGPGLFAAAIRDAALGRPAHLVAARAGMIQPMYDKDMARLLVTALFGPRPEHAIFNQPAEGSYTDDDVVAILRRVCPGAVVEVGPALSFVPPIPIIDGARARRELNFVTAYTLEAGVREMVDYFRAEAAAFEWDAPKPAFLAET